MFIQIVFRDTTSECGGFRTMSACTFATPANPAPYLIFTLPDNIIENYQYPMDEEIHVCGIKYVN
jgi:hypothetical protein